MQGIIIYRLRISEVMSMAYLQTEEARIVTELIMPLEEQIAGLPDHAEREIEALQRQGQQIVRDDILPLKARLGKLYRWIEERAGLPFGSIDSTHEIIDNVVYRKPRQRVFRPA